MTYIAKTTLVLPYTEVRKEPGDKITKKELEEAKQTEGDVATLLKSGAIEEGD